MSQHAAWTRNIIQHYLRNANLLQYLFLSFTLFYFLQTPNVPLFLLVFIKEIVHPK